MPCQIITLQLVRTEILQPTDILSIRLSIFTLVRIRFDLQKHCKAFHHSSKHQNTISSKFVFAYVHARVKLNYGT